MKRIRYISHNGVTIIFADYSGKYPKEIIEIISDLSDILKQHAKDSVLLLEDVSNAHFDNDVVTAKQSFWQQNKDYVRKIAMVGVEGLKTIIHDGMQTATGVNLPTFTNLDDAKDWLIKDSAMQTPEVIEHG